MNTPYAPGTILKLASYADAVIARDFHGFQIVTIVYGGGEDKEELALDNDNYTDVFYRYGLRYEVKKRLIILTEGGANDYRKMFPIGSDLVKGEGRYYGSATGCKTGILEEIHATVFSVEKIIQRNGHPWFQYRVEAPE